jgi:hypothetical protein
MDTLSTFFNIQNKSLKWALYITQSQGFAQVKQKMAPLLTGAPLPQYFYEFFVTSLHKGLNIDIGSILVWGWRKHEEIIEYRDKKNPPEGSHKVVLAKNTVVSKHSPVLKPKVNGVKLGEIKFDIVLKLTTNGAILLIRDGKVMEIQTGTCIGSGSIEYAGIPFIEKETAPFSLPGSIPFEQGIPI